MKIELSNTLTRRKEPFEPTDPKRVTMYVCGPTVYNYAHIGNMRPPVVFDVLFRLLRHVYGEQHVIYARNYTDIDDKIIAAAAKDGVPMSAITEKFAKIYEEDTGALGVLIPTLTPRATQNVQGMISIIEKLIANGSAYIANSGVYFIVKNDADYGKLSNRAQDDLLAGARVEGEDDKRSPSDFALWKMAKPGEPSWDAPFGAGRPGWHIECSAMIEAELGSPIDIHGGGIDLIFPHHENEIAQSESAHGHPLARVWMHNGFLTMDATKMSKSLGNIITPRELLEQGWQGETLRWALLSAHYKAPLDWSEDLMRQAQATLDGLYRAQLAVARHLNIGGFVLPPPDPETVLQLCNIAPTLPALADDLNTPAALSGLSALSRGMASVVDLWRAHPDAQSLSDHLSAFRLSADLLGVIQHDPEAWLRRDLSSVTSPTSMPEWDEYPEIVIEEMLERRRSARARKDFKEADQIRDWFHAHWMMLEDQKDSTFASLNLSAERIELALRAWIQAEGGHFNEWTSNDVGQGMRVDGVALFGPRYHLIELRRRLIDIPQIISQAFKSAEWWRNRGKLIDDILIVAPNTPSNRLSAWKAASTIAVAQLPINVVLIDAFGKAAHSFPVNLEELAAWLYNRTLP